MQFQLCMGSRYKRLIYFQRYLRYATATNTLFVEEVKGKQRRESESRGRAPTKPRTIAAHQQFSEHVIVLQQSPIQLHLVQPNSIFGAIV